MPTVSCTHPDCAYSTAPEDLPAEYAMTLLSQHRADVHPPASTTPQQAVAATQPRRPPALERPRIDVGITHEQWNIFLRRWEVYCAGSCIDDSCAPAQFFQCAQETLGDSLLKNDPTLMRKSLADIKKAMQSLAIIPIASGVMRSELLQMHQERDEAFRAFAARVRGKAEPCKFTADCSCGNAVDYTESVIRDVITNGINDNEIRREVLGTSDLLKKPVNDIIALVETKEMARNALPSNVSGISSFKRQQKSVNSESNHPTEQEKLIKKPCPQCNTTYNVYSHGRRGWNVRPHKLCIECYRSNRRKPEKQPSSDANAISSVSEEEPVSQICTLSSHMNTVRLDHLVFTRGEWKRARLRPHPRVKIQISIDKANKRNRVNSKHTSAQASSPLPTISTQAVADSGAQSVLWSLAEYLNNGFPRSELSPVSLNLKAANKSPIPIEGAFLGVLSGHNNAGKRYVCRSIIYVSSAASDLYLSYEAMLDLGIIPTDFPSIGGATLSGTHAATKAESGELHTGSELQCKCPKREMPPPLPDRLPFECIPENNERMKEWLLNRYASSTFNKCTHQQLPSMDGPPLEIHVDSKAKPRCCNTPAEIPVHWRDKAYLDLQRDVRLGVLREVPYGEPTEWCARMVLTRKESCDDEGRPLPRRTVDLSYLNRFCKREVYPTESPFHLARRVPGNTVKTVIDAWNGFHGQPIRESDKHYTTFITPFGKYQYNRAPQGFLSSGDGYNRRFDAILSDFPRKERCVDDTVHYDDEADLESHWWRTIQLLDTVGRGGVVLNPEKFQFAQMEVEFAGFKIRSSSIEPLPKYLAAIKDFPTPTCTTDVRSWFGLVNQVSNYGQLRDMMAPFKPFLSPKHRFEWSDELDAAFESSKESIIEAIKRGVEIFDPGLPTCLRPDWSNRGIGYWLIQKHCTCLSDLPDCCENGWLVTLAGSRFLRSAESRYAPIEGEALGVAWGLEQTRYFTLGCDDLHVVTDHKPLVKIFGDRALDEIHNTRLFRLKQRTLPWRFDIHYMAGKDNLAADATSRHPATEYDMADDSDSLECAIMASIADGAEEYFLLSWDAIASATRDDASLRTLIKYCCEGFPKDPPDQYVAQYWQIRDSVFEQEGVLMYDDRVIIPPSLRGQVLRQLHSAHQGISAMERRARTLMFWPGITGDIEQMRQGCLECNRNAPSNASPPPMPSAPPSTPFESVCADFFSFRGYHYLVIGDRLSGWTEIFSSPHGSQSAGSAGLLKHLIAYFTTFGIPREMSSDGGPEFTAADTERFLKRWGVHHRLSSVAFPQSNGRAEVAVKSAKRTLMGCVTSTGRLDTEKLMVAMLHLRNTPDADCNFSPAEMVFGRRLRDPFAFISKGERMTNTNIRPQWRSAWQAKEKALKCRFAKTFEKLSEHTRPLPPLNAGDTVFVQNQVGRFPKKWDCSGVVVEVLDNDQYIIRVDGSGRVTRRNRRYLRAYHKPDLDHPVHGGRKSINRSMFTPAFDSPPGHPIASMVPDSLPAHPPTSLTSDARLGYQPLETCDHITDADNTEGLPPDNAEGPLPTTHSSDITPQDAVHNADELTSPLDVTPAPALRRSSRHARRPKVYCPSTGVWE